MNGRSYLKNREKAACFYDTMTICVMKGNHHLVDVRVAVKCILEKTNYIQTKKKNPLGVLEKSRLRGFFMRITGLEPARRGH